MPAFRSGCPIASTLDLIGDKWTLVILRSLVMGATSYSDLLSAPERISTNILAGRLRKMEADGLIEQRAKRRGAASGSYRLAAHRSWYVADNKASNWAKGRFPHIPRDCRHPRHRVMRGLHPPIGGRRWRGGADGWASLDAVLVGAPC